MKERFINRAFADPTAYAAIGRVRLWEAPFVRTVKPVTQRDHQTSIPGEETRRQVALTQLNGLFPGERKKAWRLRNPEFNTLRDAIMNGNYDVFNQTKEGGVENEL